MASAQANWRAPRVALSQLLVSVPASGGYRRWDSPRCCGWSRASWAGLNGGAHAAGACALPYAAQFVWDGRPAAPNSSYAVQGAAAGSRVDGRGPGRAGSPDDRLLSAATAGRRTVPMGVGCRRLRQGIAWPVRLFGPAHPADGDVQLPLARVLPQLPGGGARPDHHGTAAGR